MNLLTLEQSNHVQEICFLCMLHYGARKLMDSRLWCCGVLGVVVAAIRHGHYMRGWKPCCCWYMGDLLVSTWFVWQFLAK